MYNLDTVFDLIASARIPEWDKERVALAVEKAVTTWVEPDLREGWRVVAVERSGQDPAPHKIDLVLEKAGRWKIVDWKTKNTGKLDDRWRMRELRSPQGRIYAASMASAYGVDVFPVTIEIRGLAPSDDSVQTASVSYRVEEHEAARVVSEFTQLNALKNSLDSSKPWPRSPLGCQVYGPMYACEFEGVCWRGEAPPRGQWTNRALSFSAAQEFLRCPERYRLLVLSEGEDEDENDRTAVGTVFHQAMEAIYRQLVS